MGSIRKKFKKIALLSRSLSTGVEDADRKRIFRGTIQSFLIQGISIALVFGSNLWLVRSTDPDSYGVYVNVFNWVSILSIFAVTGGDDLVLALIPKYQREGREGRIVQLVRSLNRWLVLATLLASGIFVALLWIFPIPSLSEHKELFGLASAAIYFTACLTLNQMILQALDHVRLSQIVEKIGKPLLLIACIGLFRLAAIPFNAKGLVILTSIVLLICSIWLLVLVNRQLKPFRNKPQIGESALNRSRSSLYFFCISLLNLLSTRIVMLLLPYFTSAERSVGILNICTRFADLLIFPFFLMHTVLPQLFARHSPEEQPYTQKLFTTSVRLMSLLCLPLLLVNILLGKYLLSWFGSDFTVGYSALVYISLAQFLFSFFGPSNTILMTQGHERLSAFCLLGYVLVLTIASCILLPIAGITGGALAMLISSLFYNGLLAIVNYRTTGIISPFFSFLVRRR